MVMINQHLNFLIRQDMIDGDYNDQLRVDHPGEKTDRKSVVQGKSVDLGGRRIIKKKKKKN